MPEAKPKCGKCGASMEVGHIPGPANYLAYRLTVSTEWFPGRPQTTPNFALGKSGRKAKTVTAWRCSACGFLESYAR